MNAVVTKKRCAVYTRVSTDERLDQSFNSLDAQREAGQAYIVSQRAEGWLPVGDDYDDGGYSGGNMERPALRRLMADIMADQIDIVVIYKIDRLTRSLTDFAKLVDVFERHKVSFVSVNHSYSQTPAAEPMVGACQAARLLNLPPYYFTKPRCRASKRIPHYRVGQMVRFRMSELAAWAITQGGAHE